MKNAHESNQDVSNARRDAARQRAAAEREQRIKKALEELSKLRKQREKRKQGSGEGVRSSTTDPEARKMKMACGGYRPAYNVQFASDGGARMIVGLQVSNSGSDRGQMSSMHDEVRQRYGKAPDRYLVDCGFANKEDITHVERGGSNVYAPIHGEASIKAKGNDPYARKKRDSDESFACRQRMASEEAKAIYKQRPSIAEYANAECRNRGLQQFRVRGLEKVRAVSLWHAITFNFMRMTSLGVIP